MPKAWDVKYPALTACPDKIDMAFQGVLLAECVLYANGYEFIK
jgi:hypothetical protein